MSLPEALIGHLVGDYLLQNDWMALNKKRSSVHCGVHCLLWAAAVVLFAGWGLGAFTVLFAAHFAQDRTNVIAWYMDKVGQRQFRAGPCSPWSTIVVDNVWHVVSIWAVWTYLGEL